MNHNKNYWRLIEDGLHDAFTNMAVDEAIFQACEENPSCGTVRFYGWNPPALSIGYFQKAQGLFQEQSIGELSLDFIRRPTGGRAVLHQDELTYSIVCPLDYFSDRGIVSSYKIISGVLVAGLRRLGAHAELLPAKTGRKRKATHSQACFSSLSLYEISVSGKKIIGSAQKRGKKCFLQQGSIMIGLDRDRLRRIFSEEDCGNMASLKEALQKEIGFSDVCRSLTGALEQKFGLLVKEELTSFEKNLASRLREEKYLSSEWNFFR
jgi:lipoate-protein ligase A